MDDIEINEHNKPIATRLFYAKPGFDAFSTLVRGEIAHVGLSLVRGGLPLILLLKLSARRKHARTANCGQRAIQNTVV